MISSGWSDMPGKSNRFFKIILTDVGSHSILLFPENFLRFFGKNLKDNIILNAPSGLEWLIDIKRHKGKVWLQNGWPEFAKYYSISFGYLLVFEYKGESKFQVLIFEPSCLEIEYPLASSDKRTSVQSTRLKKRVIDFDDSSSSDDYSSSSDDVVGSCKKTRSESSTSEASAELGQEKAAKKAVKDRAVALAKAYKSKNPFFIHPMKKSHIVGGGWPNVYIPKTFKEAHQNWQTNDKVILHVEGRSWVVFCKLNLNCSQCRISRGWTIFARDNSLKEGDVCIFELIDHSRKWFKVFISRGEESESLARAISEADKDRMIASAKAYKPVNPYFKVTVYESYLYGGSISLPKQFICRYITKGSCDVTLRTSDGGTWSVKCYIHNKCAKFSAGWKKFSQVNNLVAGDICGFELVNQSERLLDAVIFRIGL